MSGRLNLNFLIIFLKIEQLLNEKHKVVGVDPSSPPASTPHTSASNMTTPVLEGAPSSTNPSPMDVAPG